MGLSPPLSISANGRAARGTPAAAPRLYPTWSQLLRMTSMVQTFQIEPGSFVLVGVHDGLAAASRILPEGSYTTLRTYEGDRVLRLAQHVRRLEESLPKRAPLDLAFVRESLAAVLERAGFRESRLRLTFAPPRLFVSVEAFAALPEHLYRDGVQCTTVGLRRENPHAKDTRFIPTAAGASAALPAGVEDGLMLGEDGAILEGLSSNFFAVCAGELRTEAERVLPGVTRAIVLELASGLLPLAPAPLLVGRVGEASECFLTSVSRGVLPVVAIDSRVIGHGTPGPITRELMSRFDALVAREAESVAPTIPRKARNLEGRS